MKKGFTLVELLSIIVILSVISLIVFPNVFKIIEKSRNNLYQSQIRDIEIQAKNFSIEHPEFLDSNHLNPTFIDLETLKKTGYLVNDRINNPKDGSEMNGCVIIKYNSFNNQYTYEYREMNCMDDSSLSGIFVQYNNEYVVEKKNYIVPFYETLLTHYEGKINNLDNESSLSSGLYEIDDEYIFRGKEPNNFVQIGGHLYRIISLNKKTKKIKMIQTSVSTSCFSDENNNSFIDSKISQDYFVSLISDSFEGYSDRIVDGTKWKNGIVTLDGKPYYKYISSLESTSTVSNKIGLINLSDYIIASTDSSCYLDGINCKNNNYLASMFGSKSVWTMDRSSDGKLYTIENGNIVDHELMCSNDVTYTAYAVIVLDKNVTLIKNSNYEPTGDINNPYKIN